MNPRDVDVVRSHVSLMNTPSGKVLPPMTRFWRPVCEY